MAADLEHPTADEHAPLDADAHRRAVGQRVDGGGGALQRVGVMHGQCVKGEDRVSMRDGAQRRDGRSRQHLEHAHNLASVRPLRHAHLEAEHAALLRHSHVLNPLHPARLCATAALHRKDVRVAGAHDVLQLPTLECLAVDGDDHVTDQELQAVGGRQAELQLRYRVECVQAKAHAAMAALNVDLQDLCRHCV